MTEIIENGELGFLSLYTYILILCIAVCRKGKELLYNVYLGPVHPVKKSAKSKKTAQCGGGGDTTQVYPDDGLKILENN